MADNIKMLSIGERVANLLEVFHNQKFLGKEIKVVFCIFPIPFSFHFISYAFTSSFSPFP
jgi:hypothetical protein